MVKVLAIYNIPKNHNFSNEGKEIFDPLFETVCRRYEGIPGQLVFHNKRTSAIRFSLAPGDKAPAVNVKVAFSVKIPTKWIKIDESNLPDGVSVVNGKLEYEWLE